MNKSTSQVHWYKYPYLMLIVLSFTVSSLLATWLIHGLINKYLLLS